MSFCKVSGLGSGGVGIKLRPLFSTASSLRVRVWEDKLITWLGVCVLVCSVLLCLVLWLYLMNLRLFLGVGCM